MTAPAKRGGARAGSGRKPLGEPAPPIMVRVDAARRDAYEAAAGAQGLAMSEWVRRACDAALKARKARKS